MRQLTGPSSKQRQDRFVRGSPYHEMQYSKTRLIGEVEIIHHENDRMLLRDRLKQLME